MRCGIATIAGIVLALTSVLGALPARADTPDPGGLTPEPHADWKVALRREAAGREGP